MTTIVNPNKPNPADLDPELNSILSQWVEADRLATHWASREKELRQAIFAKQFPSPEEGAKNFLRLPFDKTLVGDYRINYTVDRGLLDAIKANPESNLLPIVEKVIKYRPEVSKTELKELSAEDRLAIADLLTAKAGLPGLEIKTTSKMRNRK